MSRYVGSSMSFEIGQRVVCVDDRFSQRPDWRQAVRIFPKLNSIYTIREIFADDILVGLCFEEFSNPPAQFSNGFLEPAFNSRHFRPVRETSIEVFRKLLAPNPKELIDA